MKKQSIFAIASVLLLGFIPASSNSASANHRQPTRIVHKQPKLIMSKRRVVPIDSIEQDTKQINQAVQKLSLGTAPWEQTASGANYHQVLHNGNEITYYMDTTGELATAYRAAIDDWSKLGVLKFVETSDKSKANIICGGVDDGAGSDGCAFTHIEYNTSTGEMTTAATHFTTSGIQNASTAHLQAMARHEIGHAIGFAHDNEIYLINGQLVANTMYSGDVSPDIYAPLSARNANTIRQIYGLNQ